ncbi:MAG: phosphoadenosine phosphosulfate reductase [Baekduia sp.]|nr:phosphoadenosine phosphosulfate reductase [Baekduia sp.]
MRGLGDQLTETLKTAAQHERLVFLCSFQKEESVILDELLTLAPHVRVVTIDTGVLFPETLQTWKRFEDHYGVQVEVEDAANPERPWTGPEHCCTPLKVGALERSLEGADAWITGVRREQAETRAHAELVETDPKRGIAKYNPLAFWTEKDIWSRIVERGLPYHPLHDQGYSSIGCATCTQPGDGRDGRWAGTAKTECGLHVV